MTDILINQIQTPDGTVIKSHHRHDYVSYTDKNGNKYSVDGGLEYLKRDFTVKDYFELSVLDYDPFEKIRLYWKPDDLDYLCDLSEFALERRCRLSKISELDKYYLDRPYKEKENYVKYVSLFLQEQLYRKKFQVYSDNLKELIVKYKKEEHGFKLDNWLIENFKNVPDPFIECKFLLKVSSTKNSNIHYHEIMKLIWEQFSKYEWLKGNEYETERVLNMILKPLED